MEEKRESFTQPATTKISVSAFNVTQLHTYHIMLHACLWHPLQKCTEINAVQRDQGVTLTETQTSIFCKQITEEKVSWCEEVAEVTAD